MVIDSSAIVAILLREPEAERFVRAIGSTSARLISAGTLVELSILIFTRFGDDGVRDLDLLLLKLGVEIAPVSEQQAGFARRGYRNYGKGRNPAGLNYGDCFAYALAKDTGEPLLFKGEDFSKTDLVAADY